jgi:hypothetical protein
MRVAAAFASTLPVLFAGATFQSDQLPWYYLIQYLLIGTPPGVLAFAFLGILLGVRDQRARRRSARARMLAMTQLWLLLPLLLFVVLRPNVYGGMRHFLFVLPALGVLAAYGAAGVLRLLPAGRSRVVATAVTLALLLLPVVDLVRLHPYQMTYYNALVGGVRGASGRYWTDYWLASYREAIDWVNEQAARDPERRVVAVIAAGPTLMIWAEGYAADNVELVSLTSERSALAPARYYIGSTRNDMDRVFPDVPVVHSIGRDGAVFTVIKGR